MRRGRGRPIGSRAKRPESPKPQPPPLTALPPLFNLNVTDFNMFVIEHFLRLQEFFPLWYHNELLVHLIQVYCPINWSFIDESSRTRYADYAAEVRRKVSSSGGNVCPDGGDPDDYSGRGVIVTPRGSDGLQLIDILSGFTFSSNLVSPGPWNPANEEVARNNEDGGDGEDGKAREDKHRDQTML